MLIKRALLKKVRGLVFKPSKKNLESRHDVLLREGRRGEARGVCWP